MTVVKGQHCHRPSNGKRMVTMLPAVASIIVDPNVANVDRLPIRLGIRK